MKILLNTYIGLTVLLLTDLILYLSKGISLPGHISDWALFWLWTGLTFAILIKYRNKKAARMYVIALVVFTILTMVPMMIPFLTIFTFAGDLNDKRYRINETVELMEFSKSVISIPSVVAVKSFVLYEKIIGETRFEFEVGDDYLRIEDAKEIEQLPNDKNDSLRIEFKFETGNVIRTL